MRKLTERLEATRADRRRRSCPARRSQSDDELPEFVRDNAWGHHASCTCRDRPARAERRRSTAISRARHEGLRVVDASVFPRIPGLFIVSAVYMIGEKAADVILEDASNAAEVTVHLTTSRIRR